MWEQWPAIQPGALDPRSNTPNSKLGRLSKPHTLLAKKFGRKNFGRFIKDG